MQCSLPSAIAQLARSYSEVIAIVVFNFGGFYLGNRLGMPGSDIQTILTFVNAALAAKALHRDKPPPLSARPAKPKE